jgi:uncharacterized phiE125 gp8 family phage protein
MQPVYRIITAPASEPVTLAEAALHVRQDSTDDNADLTRCIEASRRSIEKQYNLFIVTQTVEMLLPYFPAQDFMRITRSPIQSLTSLKYITSDDTEYTFASTEYDLNIERQRITLKYGKSWPSATLKPSDAVVVRMVMGYGTESQVPAHIKAALLLRIGHLYAHREEVTLGTVALESKALMVGVDHLMTLERNWAF